MRTGESTKARSRHEGMDKTMRREEESRVRARHVDGRPEPRAQGNVSC